MSSELQIFDQRLMYLPASQLQIAKAINSQLVNQVPPADVFKVLNMAIVKSYIDTGFKAPDAHNTNDAFIYQQMVNEIVVYVRTRLAGYRVNELPVAIERGCLGEFGEFMGLNKKSYIQFLNGYKDSQDRLITLSEIKKLQELPKPIPSMEEQFNTAKYNVLQAFEAHKIDQPQERLGAIVYDFLRQINLCEYSTEVRAQVYKDATARVINDAQNKRLQSDFFVRKAINKLIEDFQAGPEPGSKEYGLIVAKGKSIMTSKYFDDLILTGTNLSELVEGKREVFYKLKAGDKN